MRIVPKRALLTISIAGSIAAEQTGDLRDAFSCMRNSRSPRKRRDCEPRGNHIANEENDLFGSVLLFSAFCGAQIKEVEEDGTECTIRCGDGTSPPVD